MLFQSIHWTADVLTRCQLIMVNHLDFCEHPPCLSLPLQSASGSVLCPCLALHNTLFSSGTYPAIRKTNRWHVFAGIWEHPHTQRNQLLRSTSMDKNMEEEGKLTMWNDALCFTSNPNYFCLMQGKISWPLDSVYNEVAYSVHSYRYLLFFSHTLNFKKKHTSAQITVSCCEKDAARSNNVTLHFITALHTATTANLCSEEILSISAKMYYHIIIIWGKLWLMMHSTTWIMCCLQYLRDLDRITPIKR